MMLSESQERMLMVLKPGREGEAEAIFRKWELDFAVIGEVTDTGHMVLEWNGEVVCDIPLGPLADEAPCYERPYISQDEYKAWAGIKPLGDVPESTDIAADLLKLMASPNLASRRWIWEQYDSQVGADTVQRPGGDAAVVRVHGTKKALAITTDCTPRYVYADPVEGGKQAVAETYRNLCAVGAKPLAITNCLNFGNPQRPEIMAQFVGALEGMGEACRALDYPDRERQRLPLQREQGDWRRIGDPADAGDWRRRVAGGLGEVGDDRVQGRGRACRPDRPQRQPCRPVALARKSAMAVARALRRRLTSPPSAEPARLHPRADWRWASDRGSRLRRRRRCGRGRRNGARRRTSA